MKTYYFPIQSTSLAHYLGCAIVKPAKYFNNKPYDIQDNFNNFLLFTSKFGTTETDCCLELVLTEKEVKDLIDVNDGWFLFDVNPLPISRIRKIYFSDKEKKSTTITNIRMSTAYVPENLIDVRSFENNPTDTIKVPEDCVIIDKKHEIDKYNRFLGALALMKTAGEQDMNYSQSYALTLSFFNSIIKEQVNRAYGFDAFNDKYQGIFDNSRGFEQVLPYLDKQIDENVLNEIAIKSHQEIKKDKITRVIDIDSITDTWTYTIAILYTYGVGEEARRRKIDGLIESHFSKIKKAEGVALCYGYNRGYSAFAKEYGVEEIVSYKYKLHSRLDYYTIESVYQFVFNNVISCEFPYLDEWCPKQTVVNPKRKTDYLILDELFIGKKKPMVLSPEWWNGLFPRFYKEFSALAKPIFVFFQSLSEEIKEDFDEELKLMNEATQNKLNEKDNEIAELKRLLEQKSIENIELQKRLDTLSVPTTVTYKTEERQLETIASEPTVEYGLNKKATLKEADLLKKTKDELMQIAKQHGIKVPSKAKKDEIINLLINSDETEVNDLFSSSNTM